MLEWLKCARAKNLPVSGPLLREKAEEFAEKLGYDNFKASSGWLENFKIRNGIVHKTVCGESAAVPEEDVEKYRQEILPALIEKYAPKDIFNADETGLFFKCLPNKTLTFRNERCHGGKHSKERLTIMVAANMDGSEKLKLLVIGKSKKPRCFAGIKSLPVIYDSNKKAWMTASIYESWIQRIEQQMQKEKRKILLFVDNCPAHPKIMVQELKAVTVLFFPPNTTSKLQPMDQGIIKNFKHYYRKRIIRHALSRLEDGKLSEISLIESIEYIHKAWDDVKGETISNCFRKAGFLQGDDKSCEWDDEDDLPLSSVEWTTFKNLTNIQNSFEDFVNVDADTITTDYPSDNDIIEKVKFNNDEDSEEELNEDEETLETAKPATVHDAVGALKTVRNYIQSRFCVTDHVFKSLIYVEKFCENNLLHEKNKQTSITDFFNKK